MKLVALDDRGQWGRQLVVEALKRGWKAHVFRTAAQVNGADYAFMRIDQKPPQHDVDKAQARALAEQGVKLIPDLTQIELYDDKLAQARWAPLMAFMPRTIVVERVEDVTMAGHALGFPLLSKSAKGSASHDVRMIADAQKLAAEASKVFGAGLLARYSKQQGYMILQEFLPGNAYDYRVVRVGRRHMILQRLNRSEDQPFASGSGKCVPIKRLSDETADVLAVSEQFFDVAETRWCGIDLVRDLAGAWRVLEVTLGYTLSAYAECVFFDGQSPTHDRGEHQWKVLCDEIERGAFL